MIITGNNRLVAAHVAREVGLPHDQMLTRPDLHGLSDDSLWKQVSDIPLFAEVEPNQDERIILVLKKAGQVVGYLGDGINDAPALHAADVSISAESAVDVAKEAAELILLEKHLGVLRAGIDEGRA